MATQTEKDKSQQDFADAFNEPDTPRTSQSDDEAFGLTNADAGTDAAGGDAAAAGATAAGAEQTAAEADPAAAKEKELADREAAIKARELELDAQAASQQTSDTNEVQTSTAATDPGKGNGDGDGADEAGGDATKDARAALAEDFGPEFVELLVRLIKEVAGGAVGEHLGPLQDTVQSVIDDLKNERNIAHFKTIADAHADFQEIVEAPEFQAWIAALPEQDKANAEKVVEAGSAHEIIHMLTQFKESKQAGGADNAALEDAEGVRSGGLRLPVEPTSNQDYASAWNES